MKTRNLKSTITLVLVSVCLASCLTAQNQQLTEQHQRSIIEEAGRTLVERYVFPEIGEQCAAHLKSQMDAGAFDGVSDPVEFARLLTKELYSIAHDKHLRVRFQARPEGAPRAEDPFVRAYRQRRTAREDNFGFAKAEVLEGNVGYVDIRWFPPIEASRSTASAAMKFVSNADALIIDLRGNGGGNPSTIQYICSYFFSERTHLNSLYWRQGDRTQEFWTLDVVDGEKMPDVPIFVLTSGRTFSGGEEFAYNLKTRKRATLIGETTGGGANPGGGVSLPEGFTMFVPTGRAINPVTGTNWEGTGVEPDISCSAEEAFDLALEKASDAAKRRQEEQLRSATELIESLKGELEQAQSYYARQNTQLGDEKVGTALGRVLSGGLVDESSINDLGYLLLGEKKFDQAIGVFRFNVEHFPDSWNTYDSLGEAYMAKGETELAIEYYRKSLKLNPDNEGAKENIKKMEGRPKG